VARETMADCRRGTRGLERSRSVTKHPAEVGRGAASVIKDRQKVGMRGHFLDCMIRQLSNLGIIKQRSPGWIAQLRSIKK